MEGFLILLLGLGWVGLTIVFSITKVSNPSEKEWLIPQKISHFFLCPGLHHFSWIVLTITISETIITLNITISVPEKNYAEVE